MNNEKHVQSQWRISAQQTNQKESDGLHKRF